MKFVNPFPNLVKQISHSAQGLEIKKMLLQGFQTVMLFFSGSLNGLAILIQMVL